MKNLNNLQKITAFVAISFGVIWLGSYTVKVFSLYNLFDQPDFRVKDFLVLEKLDASMLILMPAIVTSFITYIGMIITFLVFVLISRMNVKRNGWLFITLIIILLTMPFEIYLMTYDYEFISHVLSEGKNGTYLFSVLTDRVKNLNMFPLLEIFSYLAVIYFLIFKPFTLEENAVKN